MNIIYVLDKYITISAVHVQEIKIFQKKKKKRKEKKSLVKRWMVPYSVPAELQGLTRCEEMSIPSNANFYETTI